jgi:hypothetical protein
MLLGCQQRAAHFEAGWELVRGLAPTYGGAELVFGVMISGPANIDPPKTIWISGGLAPISSLRRSGPWLLPSYLALCKYFDLDLRCDAKEEAVSALSDQEHLAFYQRNRVSSTISVWWHLAMDAPAVQLQFGQ